MHGMRIWFTIIVGSVVTIPFVLVGYFVFMFYGMPGVAPILSGLATKPDGVPKHARLNFNPKDDFYWTWCSQAESGAVEFAQFSPDRGDWSAWPEGTCSKESNLQRSDRPYFSGYWMRERLPEEVAVRLPQNAIGLNTQCAEEVSFELQQAAAKLLRQVGQQSGLAPDLEKHLVEVGEQIARNPMAINEELALLSSPCARIPITD